MPSSALFCRTGSLNNHFSAVSGLLAVECFLVEGPSPNCESCPAEGYLRSLAGRKPKTYGNEFRRSESILVLGQ